MSSFLRQVVDPSRPDGYGIWVFPYSTSNDRTPHLVAYGLGTSTQDSKVIFYLNPYNDSTPGPAKKDAPWEKREIAVLKFPVAFAYANITGNSFNDIILTDQYGSSIFTDIWQHGGRVSWYENPGSLGETAHWKRRFIGKSPGMHRVKVGHFTRTDKIQVLGVPIVVAHADFKNPAPIIVYTVPDNPCSQPVDDDTVGWPSVVAGHFLLVHEVFIFKRENSLDQIVLGGKEGISLLWFETETKSWKSVNLGRGLPSTPGNLFWGSGSVSVGKVGSDHAGYIASSEALHGNVVSVYTKPASSPSNTLSGVTWTRHVLEKFGPLKEHTGSIHQVVCVDIDGDGVDEILVALMGSDPPSWNRTGVWCFKLVDRVKGKFIGMKLSDESASMVVAGDFTGRGLVDFATVSYSVPGYFESPNPAVNLYASSPIRAKKLDEEVLFLITDPSKTQLIDEVEFLDVGGKKLSLVVLPPGKKFKIRNVEGVKVILGQLTWFDADGNIHSRTQAALPRTAVSNIVHSVDGKVQAGPNGAAFMLLKQSPNSPQPPYTDMSQLVARNIFPPRFSADVKNMEFPWVRVEDRPWANGRFKGLEFYNLIGFHVKLASDSLQNICHIQLWTAGVGVSAGFHNHIGDTFCEIHSCIVNGTGYGGMSWATVPDDQFDPNNPDPTKYRSLVVPGMHEHGPLWRTDNDGLPLFRANASVDYPWHAWIAGHAPKQSFDVWIAFEFPPLTSVSLRGNSIIPTNGIYKLCSSSAPQIVAAVKGANSTDGTSIVGIHSNPSKPEQQWQVANIPGTNTISIKNAGSRSFATSNWPPVTGQRLVGSRSSALLNTTSSWILTTNKHDIKIWLIGTKLVWTLRRDNSVVLEKEDAGNVSQNWKLEPVVT